MVYHFILSARWGIILCLFLNILNPITSVAATVSIKKNGQYVEPMSRLVAGGSTVLTGARLTVTSAAHLHCLSSSTPFLSIHGSRRAMPAINTGWFLRLQEEHILETLLISILPGLINTCEESVGVIAELMLTSTTTITERATVSPAVFCAVTFPDELNLGSFTADQIRNGVASNNRITMTRECNSNFSLTFFGNDTGDGNFRLGDDVALMLSYNYGANRIINGQAFTPAIDQNVDVHLSSLTPGVAPAAGSKTATLTATINLP